MLQLRPKKKKKKKKKKRLCMFFSQPEDATLCCRNFWCVQQCWRLHMPEFHCTWAYKCIKEEQQEHDQALSACCDRKFLSSSLSVSFSLSLSPLSPLSLSPLSLSVRRLSPTCAGLTFAEFSARKKKPLEQQPVTKFALAILVGKEEI